MVTPGLALEDGLAGLEGGEGHPGSIGGHTDGDHQVDGVVGQDVGEVTYLRGRLPGLVATDEGAGVHMGDRSGAGPDQALDEREDVQVVGTDQGEADRHVTFLVQPSPSTAHVEPGAFSS